MRTHLIMFSEEKYSAWEDSQSDPGNISEFSIREYQYFHAVFNAHDA